MESRKRERKPNFSSAVYTLILQLAEENLDLPREKFSSTICNKKKNLCWENICEKVNSLGVLKRTPSDIRKKWRAMRNEARKEMSKDRYALGNTWGGKAPAPPKATSQRIIKHFADEPGFSEIEGGIESGMCPLCHALFKNV